MEPLNKIQLDLLVASLDENERRVCRGLRVSLDEFAAAKARARGLGVALDVVSEGHRRAKVDMAPGHLPRHDDHLRNEDGALPSASGFYPDGERADTSADGDIDASAESYGLSKDELHVIRALGLSKAKYLRQKFQNNSRVTP